MLLFSSCLFSGNEKIIRRNMKKLIGSVIICSAVLFSGCGKRYVSPLETPSMTKAAEDQAYEFDFDQLNNDVIESLQDEEIYSFVNDLSISGDNGNKEIVLEIDIKDNVLPDAIEMLLADSTKVIVDSAHTQDFRIDECTTDSFGNLFDMYSYHCVVKCGDQIVREENIKAGESVPFDPGMTFEQVIG